MENNTIVPQKIKNKVTLWLTNPPSGYLPQTLENIYSQRYVYPSIHCSTFHGGLDMEKAKLYFNRELGKEEVIHIWIYYGILLSHKIRENASIWDNMDRPWEYYAKINKSDKKSYVTYNFTHM